MSDPKVRECSPGSKGPFRKEFLLSSPKAFEKASSSTQEHNLASIVTNSLQRETWHPLSLHWHIRDAPKRRGLIAKVAKPPGRGTWSRWARLSAPLCASLLLSFSFQTLTEAAVYRNCQAIFFSLLGFICVFPHLSETPYLSSLKSTLTTGQT